MRKCNQGEKWQKSTVANNDTSNKKQSTIGEKLNQCKTDSDIIQVKQQNGKQVKKLRNSVKKVNKYKPNCTNYNPPLRNLASEESVNTHPVFGHMNSKKITNTKIVKSSKKPIKFEVGTLNVRTIKPDDNHIELVEALTKCKVKILGISEERKKYEKLTQLKAGNILLKSDSVGDQRVS